MPYLLVSTRDGVQTRVSSESGPTIMEIIRANDFDELLALCGGCCSCATCHIYVAEEFMGKLPPMSDDENDLLSGSSKRHVNSRLSCQIRFQSDLDGMPVTIVQED